MSTVERDATTRVLRDYTALEHILLGDLRDLLNGPANAESCKWLLAVLNSLLDTLPRAFDLKEEDGYLHVVIERFPNWQTRVDELHRQYQALHEKLWELREQIIRERPFVAIADQVRCELRDWMNGLIAHHRDENRLVQDAFAVEIGGEG